MVRKEELQIQRQKKYFAFAIFAVLAINAWISVIAIAQDRADMIKVICGNKPVRSDYDYDDDYDDYQECKDDMNIYYLEVGVDSLLVAIISASMYSLAALFFYGYFTDSEEEE
jgi:uncharacterized membrane protein YkgB|tara:strand:+ start:362 stop:700 length:339 start_codon:yes stop_codon:yes gene_type:complete